MRPMNSSKNKLNNKKNKLNRKKKASFFSQCQTQPIRDNFFSYKLIYSYSL